MWHGNIFSHCYVCVSVCPVEALKCLKFLAYKLHFWYTGTSSEYLGRGQLSKSCDEGQGHSSTTEYTCVVCLWLKGSLLSGMCISDLYRRRVGSGIWNDVGNMNYWGKHENTLKENMRGIGLINKQVVWDYDKMSSSVQSVGSRSIRRPGKLVLGTGESLIGEKSGVAWLCGELRLLNVVKIEIFYQPGNGKIVHGYYRLREKQLSQE